MNYYKQGDAANAEQIKAAFEKLGYATNKFSFNDNRLLYYTIHGDYIDALDSRELISANLIDIVKTHHDYQELELPIAKFEVGDWVVKKNGETFVGSLKSVQVKAVEGNKYIFTHTTTGPCCFIDNNCRLWTIKDAKDGDVLATDNGWTCIFKTFDRCVFSSYCFMDSQKWFCEFGSEAHTLDSRINGNIHPATKEQHELFFAKMREAGYQWDADKKELKKIQPHYDISNFKPFDKILGRNCCRSGVWRADYFSHIHKNGKLFVGIGYTWEQCIPFNEKTKHLLGTTDPCGEEFINW